jgi:hypothetical protein
MVHHQRKHLPSREAERDKATIPLGGSTSDRARRTQLQTRTAAKEGKAMISEERAKWLADYAAQWWGNLLHPQHAAKLDQFRAEIRKRVIERIREGRQYVILECDYDPLELLREIVIEVFPSKYRGGICSNHGFFPDKYSLEILPSIGMINRKEGYGNWLDSVVCPV